MESRFARPNINRSTSDGMRKAFTTGRVDLLRCRTVSAGDHDSPIRRKNVFESNAFQYAILSDS